MDQITYDKLEAQINFQICKLKTELAAARVDLFNSESPADKKAETTEAKAPAEKKPPAKKKAAKKAEVNEANKGVDVEKVQAQVKTDTKKTAEELGIKEKPTSPYKAGSVNLIGALADLNILSPEARAPYMKGAGKWVNQGQHPAALENGVLHLDMVNEVIAGVNEKVEPISQQIPKQAEGARTKIGAELFDYMMERKPLSAAADDITALFKAKS